VLVLAEIPGAYRDFIVLFITSQLTQATPDLDFVLEPSDPAFAMSGLKVASAFRVGKVAALSDAMIGGTLGRLEETAFDEIVRRLTLLLQTGKYTP
jgi:hypothetical protein